MGARGLGNHKPIAQCINTFHMTELKRKPGTRRRPRAVASLSCETNKKQLSATDILAPATMKNAAKCDT